MENNKENNQASLIQFLNRSSQSTTSPAIFTVTSNGISSSKSINMNSQNITGLANPSKDSDAVSLDYLKSNFVEKGDPNSGYLPTTGGTLTGNINMGGNKITNLAMSTSPQDSEAVTFKYLSDKVDEVNNNQKLNEAVNQVNSVLDQISSIESALGIVPEDPNNPDDTQPPKNSQFISVNGGTMNGDLNMQNHTVTGIGTPTDADTKNAVNVEYVQSKITLPKVGILGNTVTSPSSTSNQNYLNWKDTTTTSTPSTSTNLPKTSLPTSIISPVTASASSSTPTTTPTVTYSLITTPNSDTYLKIEDSNTTEMKILGVGIVTLCFSITTSSDTKSNISVILNPPTTGSGGNGGSVSTDTVVYTIPSLASGKSVCCQIPVQEQNSILKIKDNANSTSGGSGGLTIASWSWQVTLLPSTFDETGSNP